MLRSYKIHQEQLENVARSLRELSHARLPTPQPVGRTGRGKTGPGRKSLRKPVWRTGAVNDPVTDIPESGIPAPEQVLSVAAVRCYRCGDGFPVSDFLYTKKSGLCIACWEAKVE